MLIEHIWVHVLTPVFYALLALQLGVYATGGASSGAVFVSTCVVVVAFAVTQTSAARPFHMERGAVFLALALAYLGVLASRQYTGAAILEHFHIHKGAARSVVSLTYNALWLVAVFVTLIGFLWSPTRRSPLIWAFAALLALILSVVPLETDLNADPPWLTAVRLNGAFLLYGAVALADAAFLLEFALFRHRKDGQSAVDSCSAAVDIPFARSLSWIALTLWPIFGSHFALFLAAPLIAILFYVVYVRWRFARHADRCVRNHHRFRLNHHWARPGHIKERFSEASLGRLGKEELIEVVTDMMQRDRDPSSVRHPHHRRHSRQPRATVSALQD